MKEFVECIGHHWIAGFIFSLGVGLLSDWIHKGVDMITQSNRNVFIGAHLTQDVKDALSARAKSSGKSMSALIAEAVEEKLDREANNPNHPD